MHTEKQGSMYLDQIHRIQGEIAYFKLQSWWLNELSEDERQYILKNYQPFGFRVSASADGKIDKNESCLSSADYSKHPLISGNITYSSSDSLSLLCSIATTLALWIRKEQALALAYKILDKAEELANEQSNHYRRFWFYHHKIQIYYRYRSNKYNLQKAIEACYQQINIVSQNTIFYHEKNLYVLGYYQLTVIFEKQGEYEDAIKICELALQQKLKGDWDRRIARYQKKSPIQKGEQLQRSHLGCKFSPAKKFYP